MEILIFGVGAAFGFITGGAVFLVLATNALLRRDRQRKAVRRRPTNWVSDWSGS